MVASNGEGSVNAAVRTCTTTRVNGARTFNGAFRDFSTSTLAIGNCLKDSNVGPLLGVYGRRSGNVFILIGASGPSSNRLRSELLNSGAICRAVNRVYRG